MAKANRSGGRCRSLLARLVQGSYLALPLGLRALLPKRVRVRVRDRLLASGPKSASSGESGNRKLEAVRFEEKLWAGFSSTALRDLEAMKASPRTSKAELTEVAWALARWYGAHEDYARAHENIVLMRTVDPGNAKIMRCVLLEAECLRRLGDPEGARALLETARSRKPDDPDLCLAMANSYAPEGDAIRLDWINRIYRQAGLMELGLRDPDRGLVIDNLTAAPGAERAPIKDGPRVSVIMPVYQAAATLPFALRGLLAQTWRNLEILVVDDHSPDDTVAVAEAIAATDPRVRVLPQAVNQGSYAARNAGLRAATGDFITTHDADDWSHPQKIELQMAALLAGDGSHANNSCWVRTSQDMVFRGLFRPWRRLISKNVSSILMPRSMIDQLGGWVEVRVGADSDLIRRFEMLFGVAHLRQVPFNGPLSFSLHEERSLTRQSATHVRTVYYGIRKEFHDAGEHWRRGRASPADLRIDPLRAPVPFPVPGAMLPLRETEVTCDLLFITDFSMSGGAYQSSLNYIEAAITAGLRVAVFHWRRYDLDFGKPLNPPIRALAEAGRLRIVSAGEKVRTKTVIVGYPVVLKYPLDRLPEVTFENFIVVVNQMASRLRGGHDPQYDPAELRANLREMFGTEGIWAPISGLVHQLMRADPRYCAPSDTIWIPLIDTKAWCATSPPRWRGADGARPVIGRHGRDHYTKWPSSASAIAAAYCAGQVCDVEILGGADRALEVLGAKPANWTVHEFGALETRLFLERLDFYVHYPHEEYIEEFGRAVLEALAVGLPVVLPPVFKQTFGPAAAYAEPADVWVTIARLWADEEAYLAQARAGQEFVRANSDWSQFPERLARTIAGATPPAFEPAEHVPDPELLAEARD